MNAMKKPIPFLLLLLPLLNFAQKPELVVPVGHSGWGVTHTFSPDGQYILTYANQDPVVKLWNLDGKELQSFQTDKGRIAAAFFSANGRMIIVEGTKEVVVEEPFEEYIDIPFTNVWQLDGKALIALEGRADSTFTTKRQLSLEEDGAAIQLSGAPTGETQRLPKDFPLMGYAKSMSDAFFAADGTAVIANGAWDLQQNTIQPSEEERPFYDGFTGDVLWSPDREYIFGTPADEPNPRLYPQSEAATEAVQENLGGFQGHTGPITSAAFSSDGQLLLTGSFDQTARLWNIRGENLQTFRGHPGPVWSVSFSPGHQLMLTGTEKMAKIWQPDKKEELISLIRIDSADWVATTPSGLFDASPAAMNLLHYSVFYAPRNEYITIDVEQLKTRYYEPGLLQKVLGYSKERVRPVKAFNTVALHPKVDAKLIEDSLIIRLNARNGGIGKVVIFINGKEVIEEANPLPRGENTKRDSIIRLDLSKQQRYLLRHPDSTNTISIRAYNEAGWLKSREHKLDYQVYGARTRGAGNSADDDWVGQLDPKLYVIAIGTSDYTGEQLDLQYADQDASMIAKALQSVGTALFTNGDSLEVHCLSTAPADSTGLEGTPVQWQFADKGNIEATFEALRQKAKAEDVLIVYLSGHGVTRSGQDKTQFYYLTQGVASEESLSDPATLLAYTISSEELTNWINDIPALKQVLIVDACNSGQIVENLTGGTKSLNSSQIRALDRMKDRTGMFVLSGSASDKVSYEAGEYGQGLLTYALLQGMLGVATQKDAQGEDLIDVMRLFQYARDEVPRLASRIRGIQTPMLGFPSQAASFDIGILDEAAKRSIPIGSKKPVITRSLFFNKNTFLDDLNLAERLETAFRRETQAGSRAELIYVDVHDYPGAYSVSGLYEQTDEGIEVALKLFRDKREPVRLEVDPTEDAEALADNIFRAVIEALKE